MVDVIFWRRQDGKYEHQELGSYHEAYVEGNRLLVEEITNNGSTVTSKYKLIATQTSDRWKIKNSGILWDGFYTRKSSLRSYNTSKSTARLVQS